MTDLGSVITSLDAIVLARTRNGRFVPCNAPPGWCRGLGYEALLAKQPIVIESLYPFMAAFLPLVERAWSEPGAPVVRSEFWVETDTAGEEVHLNAVAVRAGDVRVLVIARNESAFQVLQQRLQKAREVRMTHDALRREIERKDILLHTIIHDLAAPLHSIVGSLSLLDEMALPAAAERWVTIALEAAARQRDLVEGILDVFSAEYGVVVGGSRHAVDLRAALERALVEREPVARRHHVALQRPALDELAVEADDVRIIRVLTNLLDNAIQHAPPGSAVELGVRCEGNDVRISVEDRGPGVPPDLLPHLFQKLARDPKRTNSHGLGLYFCRITVEQWGGGIGYEPREGGGARFWIRLPLAEKAG